MKKTPRGIVATIAGTGTDEQRFCRRLSADVNQSQMHLASVYVTGRQVYPTHIAVLGEPDMLLRCEFRLRDGASELTCHHVADLLARLKDYHLVELHYVDGNGLQLGRVETFVELSA